MKRFITTRTDLHRAEWSIVSMRPITASVEMNGATHMHLLCAKN